MSADGEWVRELTAEDAAEMNAFANMCLPLAAELDWDAVYLDDES